VGASSLPHLSFSVLSSSFLTPFAVVAGIGGVPLLQR
jgi:hypothetical protein